MAAGAFFGIKHRSSEGGGLIRFFKTNYSSLSDNGGLV